MLPKGCQAQDNKKGMIMEVKYEYDQEKLNKAGQREGELIHTEDNAIEYLHTYKDGKLIETTNYRFVAEIAKPLIGKYKEGKPFEGYFVYRNRLTIPFIEHYESGELKSIYTCSLLTLVTTKGKALKFSKTIYKDNIPLDGLVHKKIVDVAEMSFLASEYYQNGKITNVDLWIVTGQELELIKIKMLPNGYKIYEESFNPENTNTSFKSITVEFENDESGTVLFETDNKLVVKYRFNSADLSQKMKPFEGEGSICYFFLNNAIPKLTQRHTFDINEQLYFEALQPYPQNSTLFFLALNIQPIPRFETNGNNDYYLLKSQEAYAPNSVLLFGKNESPVSGFYIEKETQPDTYKYTQYLDSKVVAKGDTLTLEALKEVVFDSQVNTETSKK